jgi:hypothetical protein
MKKNRHLKMPSLNIFFFFVLLLSSPLISQEFNFGILGGVSNSKFSYEHGLPDSVKVSEYSGFNFALLMEYFQFRYAAFQTGFRVSETGSILNYERNEYFEKIYAPTKTETKLVYLHIPLSVVLSTKTDPAIFAKASLEGGILVTGSVVYTYPDGKTRTESPPKDISRYYYNNLIGIGLSYKIEEYMLIFEVDWNRSLTGIYKSDQNNRVYSSGIIVNMGIMIDIASTQVFF